MSSPAEWTSTARVASSESLQDSSAVVSHERGRNAEGRTEAVTEVAVAGEAEIEPEAGQVDVGVSKALEREPQP